MIRAKIILIPVLLTALVFSFISCSDAVSTDSEKTEKVSKTVDSCRTALETTLGKTVPSLNILIHTPSAYIFHSSGANISYVITNHTYFRFASNTKNITSAAVLNMMEDGWLDINDYITDTIPGSSMTYVPSTAEWNIPNKNQITIEMLLQHSAGVYDVCNDSVPGSQGMSYVEYIESINSDHQFTSTELVGQVTMFNLSYFLPGTNHHYSNTGYTMLGEIIARVYTARKGTAKTFSDYLYDYITGGSSPVCLPVRFPHIASDKTMTTPFVTSIEYLPEGNVIFSDANMSAYVAEGNGFGTMAQLDTYIRSLMKGTGVLNSSTVEMMKTRVSPVNATYGLGCAYYPNLGYGHTGATHGYLSFMMYDPITDVSVIGLLPMMDLTQGRPGLITCFSAMLDAGYAARTALGYAGKPVNK